MGLVDLIWLGLILGGAGTLLYRSVWKKKGHCGSCSSCDCSTKR